MERCYRPPTRHRRNQPSFSSSLLDAIYRSIDDDPAAPRGNLTTSAAAHEPAPWSTRARAVSESPVTRSRHFSAPSTSSSDSSDADTARILWPRPIRTGPVLTRTGPIRSETSRSAPLQTATNPKKSSASLKKKLRDLKKSSPSSSSSSPGAKLAGFLNSLFAAASGSSGHKKAKMSPRLLAEDPLPSPSTCSSSASSYSRSCLSKTPSTRGSIGCRGGRPASRSVRFCPEAVIVGCGEKSAVSGGVLSAAAAAESRKRAVMEMLRGLEVEMEDDESDDGSEDLFELENLAGIGGGTGKFRDELPVYGTTDIGVNYAISRGLVV